MNDVVGDSQLLDKARQVMEAAREKCQNEIDTANGTQAGTVYPPEVAAELLNSFNDVSGMFDWFTRLGGPDANAAIQLRDACQHLGRSFDGKFDLYLEGVPHWSGDAHSAFVNNVDKPFPTAITNQFRIADVLATASHTYCDIVLKTRRAGIAIADDTIGRLKRTSSIPLKDVLSLLGAVISGMIAIAGAVATGPALIAVAPAALSAFSTAAGASKEPPGQPSDDAAQIINHMKQQIERAQGDFTAKADGLKTGIDGVLLTAHGMLRGHDRRYLFPDGPTVDDGPLPSVGTRTNDGKNKYVNKSYDLRDPRQMRPY